MLLKDDIENLHLAVVELNERLDALAASMVTVVGEPSELVHKRMLGLADAVGRVSGYTRAIRDSGGLE